MRTQQKIEGQFLAIVLPCLLSAARALAPALLTLLCMAQSAEAQTLTILHSFAGGADGSHPSGTLIRDSVGALYGTTETGGTTNVGTVFRVGPLGHETILYSFGPVPDGQQPNAGLVRDKAGNFYGTTIVGGKFQNNGTVFKLTDTHQESVLYNFLGGTDGSGPEDTLVIDSVGNLYGTTVQGGSGPGTVFEINPAGQETILHFFGHRPDGHYPHTGLVRDSAGNLYGTAFSGGAFKRGMVFMLNAAGQETVLYSFSGPPNGAYPWAGLYRDAAGNLFGTTLGGGKSKLCNPGCGTVFKLTKAGKESVLYSFSGLGDGAGPYGGLSRDAGGNLYGTTFGGGNPTCNGGGGCGTVFRLSQRGTFTTLYKFGGVPDGSNPYAGVILDSSGNLYGTTFYGGASNDGVVFKLMP